MRGRDLFNEQDMKIGGEEKMLKMIKDEMKASGETVGKVKPKVVKQAMKMFKFAKEKIADVMFDYVAMKNKMMKEGNLNDIIKKFDIILEAYGLKKEDIL